MEDHVASLAKAKVNIIYCSPPESKDGDLNAEGEQGGWVLLALAHPGWLLSVAFCPLYGNTQLPEDFALQSCQALASMQFPSFSWK